ISLWPSSSPIPMTKPSAPPQNPAEFADFCAAMIRRYIGGHRATTPLAPPVEVADAFEKADVAGPD
ncbi:MAG TPA: hypothetical protein PLD10_22855, partial [Rhodopila sp.]|nr:hypothetical protein [Rhodopila sp.]